MSTRKGFTLVELLVVIAIIGILVALLLPAVQAAREAGRRSSCSNNFKQIGLALHNYHDTHRRFPMGFSEAMSVHIRECWMQLLLPFMEQAPMFNKYMADGNTYIMDVPASIKDNAIPVLLCPSDGANPAMGANGGYRPDGYGAAGNYVGCAGDNIMWASQDTRGLFGNASKRNFASVTDGTSNTLAFSEVIIRGPVGQGWGDGGSYWGGARWGGYGFTTLQAPNTTIADQVYECKSTTFPKAPCTSIADSDADQNFARSYHPGGVQVGLVDGSVRFLSQTISLPTYQALSTINVGEVVGEY